MKITLCRRCVNPSSRPNIGFDSEGVCPVCRYEESKRNEVIHWKARRAELEKVCEWGRANTRANYDCIVTGEWRQGQPEAGDVRSRRTRHESAACFVHVPSPSR